MGWTLKAKRFISKRYRKWNKKLRYNISRLRRFRSLLSVYRSNYHLYWRRIRAARKAHKAKLAKIMKKKALKYRIKAKKYSKKIRVMKKRVAKKAPKKFRKGVKRTIRRQFRHRKGGHIIVYRLIRGNRQYTHKYTVYRTKYLKWKGRARKYRTIVRRWRV